jgi:hypothetical protein
MNIFDITKRHGKDMYMLALEHAISMIEIAGDDALEILKNRLEEEKAGEDGHSNK